MNKVTSSLIFLLSFALFQSCGNQSEAEESLPQGNPNNYSWTQPLKAPVNYTQEEMGIANTVCQALQKKRAFVTANGTLNMDFSVTERNCGVQTDIEKRVSGIMRADRSGSLRLTNQTRGATLFEDVISDQHPKIKNFCDLILRGEAPSNTVRDGALRYQVTFFRQLGFDWIQIAEFREIGNNFYPFLIERMSVLTTTSNSPENSHGFIKLRGVNTPCADNLNTKTVMQEWL